MKLSNLFRRALSCMALAFGIWGLVKASYHGIFEPNNPVLIIEFLSFLVGFAVFGFYWQWFKETEEKRR